MQANKGLLRIQQNGHIIFTYDRLLSVCPSVCDAVHSDSEVGVEGYKLHQRVPSRHVPICPFKHFFCRMYRLATKRIANKRSKKRHVSVYGLRLHACMGVEKVFFANRRTAASFLIIIIIIIIIIIMPSVVKIPRVKN